MNFAILSGKTFFRHKFSESGDWILENTERSQGSIISMELSNYVSRTDKEIFDRFTSGEDFAFAKTIVPVQLAQYNSENLISQVSSKKDLCTRVDQFKIVTLGFQYDRNCRASFCR